jgi:hypothetical protein
MESRAAQPRDYDPPAHGRQERVAFRHSHSTLGVAGHWIRTAGILAPLLIGEFVKDHEKRWRWIRIASVATAGVSEILYTQRIEKEREWCEQRRQSEKRER